MVLRPLQIEFFRNLLGDPGYRLDLEQLQPHGQTPRGLKQEVQKKLTGGKQNREKLTYKPQSSAGRSCSIRVMG